MRNRRRPTRVITELSRIERSQPVARPDLSGPRNGNSLADQAIPVAVRDFLQKLSLFTAPPTLVIALAYWFGWTLTSARSAYFGIDSSTLGYSTTDYLLRSADAAFVPVAIVLLVVLAAILLHGLILRAAVTHRGPAAVRRGAAGGAAFGAFLTFFAVWSLFRPGRSRDGYHRERNEHDGKHAGTDVDYSRHLAAGFGGDADR